jgi:hypothetical protein
MLTLHDAMQPRAESERQVEVSVPHAGQLDSQATNVDPKPAQSNQSQQQEEAKQEGRQQEEKNKRKKKLKWRLRCKFFQEFSEVELQAKL